MGVMVVLALLLRFSPEVHLYLVSKPGNYRLFEESPPLPKPHKASWKHDLTFRSG
jgi:hypothetical protein